MPIVLPLKSANVLYLSLSAGRTISAIPGWFMKSEIITSDFPCSAAAIA